MRAAHLPQRARHDNVVHPLHRQAAAQLDGLDVTLPRAGEGREQEAHGEGVIQVTERINEGRVPDTQTHTSTEP